MEAGCLGRKLMIHDLSDGKAKGKNEPQKKRRAKILGSKQTASIRIDLKKPICLELFSDFRQLGRFTLRDQVTKGEDLRGLGEEVGGEVCVRNWGEEYLGLRLTT